MGDPNVSYATLLLVAALVSATVTVVVARRVRVPVARPVVLLMLALTWWSFTYALYWLDAPRPWRFFWLDATYLGAVAAPTALLAFVLRYTNRQHWLPRRAMFLLAIEPVVTFALLWTDSAHGLFFAGRRSESAGAILSGGPWFWVNAAYSYALILLAVLLLLRTFGQAPRLYRGQIVMILLGALMPWASNIIDLTNLSAFPNLDLTPLAFTLTGMSFAYGILRYRFLDIVPVAHDALVEVMNDGVLVLDARERIVYINSAAQRLLGNGGTAAIGRYAEDVLAAWPGLAAFSHNVTEGQAETVLVGQTGRHLEARIATLQAQGGSVGGRLLLLRDITDRKVAEDELHQAHTRLQLQLAEIEALHVQLQEEAIRDYLTGLFNRRYLEETLEREIARCEREREPLSVAVLDADLFKEINDGYGHKAGDIMLQATARLLMANIRRGDAACRYGGDEFVVILPGASLGNALQRLERLRSLIAALRVPYESSELHATVSIGLAAYPDHGKTGDALLRAADDALYAAKNAGGNCVMTARRRKGPPPNDECSCSTPI